VAKRYKKSICNRMREAFQLVRLAQIANILQLLTSTMTIMSVFLKSKLVNYSTKKREDLMLFLICVLLSNSDRISFGP